MSYFIDCARAFLKAARDNKWPLDFFSFHSYSGVSDALAQIDYCRNLLDEYGFRATEMSFNEWLPGPSRKKLGTARQAAEIAAMLAGLQNGPCANAMIYDARCGIGDYSPLFNPLTYKPHPAYFSFVAFNELRKLGRAVACTATGPLSACAAAKEGRLAVLVANPTKAAVSVEWNLGVPEKGLRCRLTDESGTDREVPLPTCVPAYATILVFASGVSK